MASSDHSSDLEFSNGLANSKNGIESSSNIIQKMIDDQFKARDEKITQLQNQVERLQKENQKLLAQVSMSPDQLINNRSFDHRQKAQELKNAITKVVDDVLLNQDHSTRQHVFNNYNNSKWNSASTPTTSHTE
ncbi:19096_t:CDS:2, partial [Dentiscutata erythropus]